MQCPFNPGPIVLGERAHTMDGVFNILARDSLLGKIEGASRKMSLGLTAEIQNNFNEVSQIGLTCERVFERWGHNAQQEIEIICDFLAWQIAAPRSRFDLLPYDHAR